MNGIPSSQPAPRVVPIAFAAFAPTPRRVGPFAWSLFTHLSLLLAVIVWLKLDSNSARLRGEAGLVGHPGKRGTVMIDVSATPEKPPIAPRALTKPFSRVAQKIPAHLPSELPHQLKSETLPKQEAKTATAHSAESVSKTPMAAPLETTPGEGGQNGTGAAPTKNTIGNSDRSNPLGIHLQTIREAIQKNLRRPGFRLTDGSKTTSLRLQIAPSGELVSVEIHLSSGDPRLDQLALLAVKRAAPFRPYSTELAITIPAIFKGDTFR